MKATVLKKPKDLGVEDIPYPKAEPYWALVKVYACGICGSDLRYYEGENPWALHTLGYNKPSPPNIVLGHEFAGEIIDVGRDEDKHRIGERVGILAYKPCGICDDCKNADHNLCADMLHIGHAAGWPEMDYYPGGMAEVCQVPIDCCYKIPENVSYEEAACGDFVAVAYHSISLAGNIFNKTVVVLGCGPVGNCIAQLARSNGARVITVDTNSGAVSILKKLNFEHVIESYSSDEILTQIKRLTNSRGVFAVWDSVGSGETVLLGVKLLENSGSYINLATHDVVVPMQQTLLFSERKMMSSSNNKLHFYPNGLKAISQGLINVKALITRREPLDRVVTAFQLLLNKNESNEFKIIIQPNG